MTTFPTTARTNHERLHRRFVTTISYWARAVPEVRHMDLDLYQICGTCKEPEILFEVKGSNPPNWSQTRLLGRLLNARAALVVEPFATNFQCTAAAGCPCDCHTHAHHETIKIAAVDQTGTRLWDKTQPFNKDQFQEFLYNCHQAHVETRHAH